MLIGLKIKAQVSMVMNLDKCIDCHTCSITCKNVWTNRAGAEYMYFNNVETKPGIGYPKNWEDQERWKGGWEVENGELSLRSGSKLGRILKLFYHPEQPEMDDYYEPWTYDYETLISSPRKKHQPVARPRSLITQKRMEIKWGPNWGDDLAGGDDAENGLPSVCTDTCVGRIRYMGVLLYDMDAVCDAAKISDEKMIVANMLDIVKDPNDPAVIESARQSGVSEMVLKAAQESPVYQIIKSWKLALPLHPEYRTLPMVWYISPLSSIAKNFEDRVYLPKS